MEIHELVRQRQRQQIRGVVALILGSLFLSVTLRISGGNVEVLVLVGVLYIVAVAALMILARVLHADQRWLELRHRIRLRRRY